MLPKVAALVRQHWGFALDNLRGLNRDDHIDYDATDRAVYVATHGADRLLVKWSHVECADLNRLFPLLEANGFPTIFPLTTRDGRHGVRVDDHLLLVFPFKDLTPSRDLRAREDLLLRFHALDLPDDLVFRRNETRHDVERRLRHHPVNAQTLRDAFPDFDDLLSGLPDVIDGGEAPHVIHGSPWLGNYFEVEGRNVLIDFDSVRLANPRFDLVRLVEAYPIQTDDPTEGGAQARATIARFAREQADRFGDLSDLRALFLGSLILAIESEPRFFSRDVAMVLRSGMIPPA